MTKAFTPDADKTGKVQYFYGAGKGKTSAAVGVAVRAYGAGLSVAWLALAKTLASSEFVVLQAFEPERCHLEAFGLPEKGGKRQWLVPGRLTPEQRALGRTALEQACQVLQAAHWDVVVLDEFADGPEWGLFEGEALLKAIAARPKAQEVVITGHKPWQALVEYADLVTELRKVKHYFDAGTPARKGFEF